MVCTKWIADDGPCLSLPRAANSLINESQSSLKLAQSRQQGKAIVVIFPVVATPHEAITGAPGRTITIKKATLGQPVWYHNRLDTVSHKLDGIQDIIIRTITTGSTWRHGPDPFNRMFMQGFHALCQTRFPACSIAFFRCV